MSALPQLSLVAIATNGFLALLWGVIVAEYGRLRRVHRTTSTMFTLNATVGVLFAAHFVGHLIVDVTPSDAAPWAPPLHRWIELGIQLGLVFSAPLMRHIVPLVPLSPKPPSRAWLTVNYGSAALVAAFVLAVGPRAPSDRQGFMVAAVVGVYVVAALSLGLIAAYRLSRSGSWRQGPVVVELRSPDLAVIGAGLLGAIALFAIMGSRRGVDLASIGGLLLHFAVGLAFAVPFAVRMLGRVVRGMLVAGSIIAVGGAIHLVTAWAVARAAQSNPALAELTSLAGFGVLLLALVPGQAALREAVDWLLFRRGRMRQVELQEIVARLDPARGVTACCRLALDELARTMHFRGAGILLVGERGGFATLGFTVEPVLRARRDRESEDLPQTPLMEIELRALPAKLRDALIEADVARVFPISSPRQRWGHLLVAENLLAAPFNDGDVAAVSAFLGQLALALDAAELLERALGVERALAHREKLAAIGELAARVAHEIRNPVTAARSLAQLLVRDPAAPHREEHELILSQLERIERQVAALLRFARRDELRQARVDLAELVRGAIGELRPVLDEVGIATQLDLQDGLVADADPDKLRQVLVNLVENARDALLEVSSERRLAIGLDRRDGAARLVVADNGAGIADEALQHLFEPFFSQKANGTGLGLAIVRRTVEAHGGTISAARAQAGGAAFTIDLPLCADA